MINDRRTVLVRVIILGTLGVISAVATVVLVLAGHSVEGTMMFGLSTMVAGAIAGAPRSSDTPPAPPPTVVIPPPPAASPVEQVTTDTLAGWIAGAEKWGPDDLEAH